MSHKLSVIMPAYNEGSHIQIIMDKVCGLHLAHDAQLELIVVNDGSRDDTHDQAQAFMDAHPEADIRLIDHAHNRGKGAGIRTALQYVTGDYVVIQDGDDELDPRDFAAMFAKMVDENLPVLYGSRFLEADAEAQGSTFYFGNKVLAWVANLLYGLHITDEATCYKMFRTEILKSIPLKCEGFEFCPEVTAKIARRGYRIPEVPIHYHPRSFEQGKKIRAKDGLQAILTLLRYRFGD